MICEFCAKDSDELYNCRNCDLLICINCQIPYTQFNHIDYNCCIECGGYDGYKPNKNLAKRKIKLRKLKSPTFQ